MLLRGKNIHKQYVQAGQTLHILKGIDFTAEFGEVIAIVGPSGAGKSTLLHILGGLDEPNDGQVILADKDLYELNDAQRARARNADMGFIFQFYHLLPEFTALENVMLPALVKDDKIKDKASEEKAVALLDRVGLKKRLTHKPNQLSGGEQQRVAIARALINDPKIIFCDEPTGNLDSESGKEIINLLMELNKQNKQTLVMVTHDEGLANVATRKIAMRDGQLVGGR